MLYKKVIQLPMYECKVIVMLTDKIEPCIKKVYKKEGFAEDDSKYDGLCLHSSDHKDYYIIVDYRQNFFNTSAHELRHCVDFILSHRSFVLKESDEAAAYLSGYINAEIMKLVIDKNVPVQ